MTTGGEGLAAYAVRLSRPRFWIYTGGTYVVGYSIGMPDWHAFLLPAYMAALLYFFFPANLFIYGVNDLFDEATDRNNPKKGEREYRFSTDDRARLLFLIGLSVATTVFLALAVPDPRLGLVLLGFLFLAGFYSAPPLRFKRVPFLDFCSNYLYVMPGVYGFVLASGEWPPAWLLLGGFFHIAAMHLFSAIPDIDCDRCGRDHHHGCLPGPETIAAALPRLLDRAGRRHDRRQRVSPAQPPRSRIPGRPSAASGVREIPIERVYWWLPALNTALGGLVFVAMTVSKGGF